MFLTLNIENTEHFSHSSDVDVIKKSNEIAEVRRLAYNVRNNRRSHDI